MKSKFKIIIAFILFHTISFSQPKDTIYGKIKSIREELVFLDNNRQNRKLFSSEGDYGHNGFSSEEYTKERFNSWWYQTFWVHYINYYKEFDVSGNLLKVFWFNKNQSIFSSFENKYNVDNKLINQEFIQGRKYNVTYQYDTDNNLIFSKSVDSDENTVSVKKKYNTNNQITKVNHYCSGNPKEKSKNEYYYDNSNNLIVLKKFDEYGESFGTKFEYDLKNRKTKVIDHYPYINIKTKAGITTKRTRKGKDLISKEFKYDDKDRVIETKFYHPDYNNEDIAQLGSKQVKIYDKDLLKYIYDYDNKDSITGYYKYEFDNLNRKTKEFRISLLHPNNNLTLEYFYSTTEFPIKLMYTDTKISVQIDFEYIFDERNNWIEQTKSVDCKKLYVWKRELKYFD